MLDKILCVQTQLLEWVAIPYIFPFTYLWNSEEFNCYAISILPSEVYVNKVCLATLLPHSQMCTWQNFDTVSIMCMTAIRMFGLSKRPILGHHAKAHILKSTQNLIKSDVSTKTLQFGGCREGAMTQDFMKSWFIAPLLHSSNWTVLVETFALIRFWVDFTWNPLDFMWNPQDFMWNRKTTCKEL